MGINTCKLKLLSMNMFEAPSWWNQEKALFAAKRFGLHTETREGVLHIEVKYVDTSFTIEGSNAIFKGYKCLMLDDWNGWAIPYFTKEQMTPVFEDFNKVGAGNLMKWDGERAMHLDQSWPSEEWEAIEPEEAEIDGEKVTLYNMGCGLCWTELKFIPAPKPVKKLVTHVMTEEYWELSQEQWDQLNAHMIEQMGPDWETNQESNDVVRDCLYDFTEPKEEYSNTGDDTFRFID